MSTTTQQLILDALVKKLEEHGGTVILDQEWANTGTVRYVPKGSLTPRMSLTYNFQRNNASIGRTIYRYDGRPTSADWIVLTAEELITRAVYALTEGDMT